MAEENKTPKTTKSTTTPKTTTPKPTTPKTTASKTTTQKTTSATKPKTTTATKPKTTTSSKTTSSATVAKSNTSASKSTDASKSVSTKTESATKPVSPSGVKPKSTSSASNTNKTTSIKPTGETKTNTLNNNVKNFKQTVKPNVKNINAENLDKNIIAEDKEEDKKKKKKFLIIFFIIFFILALLVTGIILLTSIKPSSIKFSVEVDGNVDTGLYDDNNNLIGTLKYLPGDMINADMNVIITNENSPTLQTADSVYLRIKIDVYVDDNYYSGFFEPTFEDSTLWTIGDDGYCYYNLKSNGNETITVFNELEFIAEKDNNVLNGKTGKLVLVAEILEGNSSAIGQEWHTSPNSWRNLSAIKG